jgi:hypothetical protein
MQNTMSSQATALRIASDQNAHRQVEWPTIQQAIKGPRNGERINDVAHTLILRLRKMSEKAFRASAGSNLRMLMEEVKILYEHQATLTTE